MIKAKLIGMLCGVFVFVLSLSFVSYANDSGFIAIENIRQMGEKVSVPVYLKNFSEVATGKFTVSYFCENNYFNFDKISFEGADFNGVASVSDGVISVSFISKGGGNVTGETAIVCYLLYKINEDASIGDYIDLKINDVKANDRSGSNVSLRFFDGIVEKNYMLGDITGNDKVTPVSAIKIMQYNQKGIQIQDPFKKASVDLSGNGNVGLTDAQAILDYVVGKEKSFFTIKTQGALPNVLLDANYYYKLETMYGNPPYKWQIPRSGGFLPRGLTLDTKTGTISGKVTSIREVGEKYSTIAVTDRDGNLFERKFRFNVIDSDIKEVAELSPISVSLGEKVDLPERIEVLYKDGQSGYEVVLWDDVDTSIIGSKVVRGSIRDFSANVVVEVVVIDQSYLEEKNITYYDFLNIHAILFKVSDDVFSVTIDGNDMLYEGDNWFGRNTSLISPGQRVNVVLYDRFGNVLETTQVIIKQNF